MRPATTTTFLLLVMAVTNGCAGVSRQGARRILMGVGAGTAALAVGGAIAGYTTERSLRDDVDAGKVTGSEFVARDKDGLRWNRLARFGAFATGLCAVGLGVAWEMDLGEKVDKGQAASTGGSPDASLAITVLPLPPPAAPASATKPAAAAAADDHAGLPPPPAAPVSASKPAAASGADAGDGHAGLSPSTAAPAAATKPAAAADAGDGHAGQP